MFYPLRGPPKSLRTPALRETERAIKSKPPALNHPTQNAHKHSQTHSHTHSVEYTHSIKVTPH